MPKSTRERIRSEWREWWDERVAIMQTDGLLSKEEAEKAALVCLQEWAKTHKPLDYSREGKVYILHEVGTAFYKIGRSAFPLDRKNQLQAGTSGELQLLREIYHYDCITLEKLLHTRYKPYRKRGEWFALPPDVLQALLTEYFPSIRSSATNLYLHNPQG